MRKALVYLADAPTIFRRRMATNGRYRPEIDGLRFFAISIVLLGHFTERVKRFQDTSETWLGLQQVFFDVLAQPGPGVLLFFGISGFIIASQLAKAEGIPAAAGFLGSYLKRRILRIEPPYLLLLVFTFVFLSLTGFVPPGVQRFSDQNESLLASFLASIAYSHGWLFGTPPRIFGPGWSLEIEVQFYTAVPFIFSIVYSVWRSPRFGAMIGALALVAATFLALLLPSTDGAPFLQRTILKYFPFFWIGVMFAVHQNFFRQTLGTLPPIAASILGWGGVALVALSPTLSRDLGGARTEAEYLMQMVGITGAFAGVMSEKNNFRSFCSVGWISLIGSACYSIYLTHLQFLQISAYIFYKFVKFQEPMTAWFVGFLFLMPPTLVVGLIFYIVVERTFMIPDWPSRLLGRFGVGVRTNPDSSKRKDQLL